jgi:hypothetical protein
MPLSASAHYSDYVSPRAVRALLSKHRTLVGIAVIAALAVIVFVFVYFEPHKLFIDDTVSEAVPESAVTNPEADISVENGEGDSSTRSFSRTTLAEGPFHGLEHDTSGKAVLLDLADGRRFLRFEDFETSNGPDLRVYLSEIPAGDDWFAYGERFIDLGPLKGNIGDQNYEIPPGTDLSRYRSAVVWCRQFSVGFGVAPLD